MKISKRQLRRIIKEELSIVLKEMDDNGLPGELTPEQQQDFDDCWRTSRGLDYQGSDEQRRKECYDEVTSELYEEDLQEIFGLGKKLSPDVRDAVDKIKSVNLHDDDPAITQTGRGKWNKHRKSHINKLKKGELSPEEAKRLYGV
jgi:hypothetical protein